MQPFGCMRASKGGSCSLVLDPMWRSPRPSPFEARPAEEAGRAPQGDGESESPGAIISWSTLSENALSQKSGLSAVGIAASCPGNHWVSSAQTCSAHSTNGRPYVMVADQGIVKAPSSSTVNWSCKYFPDC